MKFPIKLLAIPNANDQEIFDLAIQNSNTTTVYCSLMKDLFYTQDKDTYVALRNGRTVELVLTAEAVREKAKE